MAEYKRINSAGGLCIPVKLRREYNVKKGDPVEIEALSDGGFIVRPYEQRCVFCDGTEKVTALNGKGICDGCLEKLTKGEK